MTRLATKLALCLFIGLALSVAIAWIGVMFELQPGTTLTSPMVSMVVPAGRPAPRPLERLLKPQRGVTWELWPQQIRTRGWVVRREQYVFEAKMEEDSGTPATPQELFFLEVYRAGWPAPALEWTECVEARDAASWRAAQPRAGVWEYGVEYRSRTAPTMIDEQWRRLPLRPVGWGMGLAVNTLIWAVPSAGVVVLPGEARRWRRRKRGLCLACGYPTRDASGRVLQQCPECGAAACGGTSVIGSSA